MYYSALVSSVTRLPRTWNLKQDWFIFKSLKCDFWISYPKKLPHIKFQDERMTRTILITENVNSKWQILPRQNIHFKFSNLNNFRSVRSWGLKFSGIDHGLSAKILFIETITNIEKRNKIWEVRLRRVSLHPGWLLVDCQTQHHPWV